MFPRLDAALLRERQAVREGFRSWSFELACARALEAGDPLSYRTVKGVLAVGTERDSVQLSLPGITVPAWLRGPAAFGGGQQ